MSYQFIAVNLTGSSIVLKQLNAVIPAFGTFDLQTVDSFYEIQASDELLALIQGGSVIINDGTSNLSQAESVNYICPIFSKVNIGQIFDNPGFSAYSTSTITINSITFVDLPLNVQRYAPNNTIFTHTVGQATVTILVAGRYEVSYFIGIDNNTSSNRASSSSKLVTSIGGPFFDAPGSLSYGYHRTVGNGEDSMSFVGTYDVPANTTFKIQSNRISGVAVLNFISNACGLNIKKVA